VLYSFTGGNDGGQSYSSLTEHNGNFFGATEFGGVLGYGVVFELSPNGSGGWTETVLHEFTLAADGGFPHSTLTFDSAGNLYGTAVSGGESPSCPDEICSGVVFELSPTGTSWTETVLYSFTGGADGGFPQSGPIMDSAGNLYGTTYNSDGGAGSVFELSPSANGWTEKEIYTVNASTAEGMYAGLTMDAAGNMYGSTGAEIFELSPNGSGGWSPTVIHTFVSGTSDGFDAEGTLVLDKTGNLYGTTEWGGANATGTVYELSHASGSWTEKILYSFSKSPEGQGTHPWGGVIFDAAGNLYGTTTSGGLSSTFCQYNCGTVFELVAPASGGSYQEKVLFEFNYLDGENPVASLVMDSAGKLYGTTESGGPGEIGINGLVFELNPSAASTETELASSANPSKSAQAVTFTAVVTSSVGVPPNGETVSFMKGATLLGTGTLNDGSASFSTSSLAVGTDAVTAMYAGDANFLASTSNTVEQVVNKAAK
jgi:uncharacterized repeat protein (TIGR03803 family)